MNSNLATVPALDVWQPAIIPYGGGAGTPIDSVLFNPATNRFRCGREDCKYNADSFGSVFGHLKKHSTVKYVRPLNKRIDALADLLTKATTELEVLREGRNARTSAGGSPAPSTPSAVWPPCARPSASNPKGTPC